MRQLAPGAIGFAASLAFAGWAYRKLPSDVVTHWGVDGRPDGWSSPLTAVLVFPAIGLLLLLVFWVLPRIDPRREAYTGSSSPYWIVANIVMLVVAVLHIVVLGNALGWAIRIPILVPVMVGGLFVVIGILMPRMQPSWFMGIRTPWTLSSDEVWARTHRMGGKFWVGAGVLLALAALGGRFWLYTGIGGAAFAVLAPVVYSWWLWRDLQGS
ncbi:MAG: SdpI family protein [Gemmatimonadota bacterium]|nr:SdpI family protein [Gemmatimonadota bacterium]MDH4348806.1 SdpI family protein [Gemmatimonadota bacterium]MDH5284241.1 SdpI family protein [Gemmatimonadota bacterium]